MRLMESWLGEGLAEVDFCLVYLADHLRRTRALNDLPSVLLSLLPFLGCTVYFVFVTICSTNTVDMNWAHEDRAQ